MKSYSIEEKVEQDLRNRFVYHTPLGDNQTDRYAEIRRRLHTEAEFMTQNCPPSRELSLAFTKLEEAMFWANAAIARNEKLETKTEIVETNLDQPDVESNNEKTKGESDKQP